MNKPLKLIISIGSLVGLTALSYKILLTDEAKNSLKSCTLSLYELASDKLESEQEIVDDPKVSLCELRSQTESQWNRIGF